MTPMTRSFVLHFGEMGSRWGINRTVGQIYALLMMSGEPLHAEEIMTALQISRGNTSMGLRELQSWQLVRVVHRPGERKEYFEVAGTVRDMALRIMEERRKRELEPTLSLLRSLLMEEPTNDQDAYAQQRMEDIHELLDTLDTWSREIQGMSAEKLQTLMNMGAGIGKVLDARDRLMGRGKKQGEN